MAHQIILKVYLDNTNTQVVEVPITPDTICRDVIDCCKEPGEEQCHLAELWRGCERSIGDDERPYEILQQWGIHRDEVHFYLRHEPSTQPTPDGRRIRRRNGVRDDVTDDQDQLPSGVDLTLSELQEMATRQQQQIEAQQQMLVAKEQRLKFLKQQELRHQQIASENERLRKLREKVEAQELKLKKLRALRGQVSEHKSNNSNLTAELETIKALFNEKEKELSVAVSKVEELTHQLEGIRNGHVNNRDNKQNSQAQFELDKLRKELLMRNKLNEQQNSKLLAHREVLHQRKDEMSRMDERITELQARLKKKRSHKADTIYNNLANQQRATFNNNNNANSTKLGNRPMSSANIAAVEPYMKHVPKEQLKEDVFLPNKQDPKYQTLPYNIKFPSSDSGGGGKVEGDVNSNVYLAPDKRQVPPGGKYGHELRVDTTSNTTGGKEMPSPASKPSPIDYLHKEVIQNKPDYKPSVGHSIAFEALEETLKQADTDPPGSKSMFGLGYRPPTTLTNFTPRPFGTTYSTAKFANKSNLVSGMAASPSGNDSIMSTGAGFPKTSTPIASGNNNNEMKEIFITGAPSVTAPNKPYTNFSQGQRGQGQISQPLNVMTSADPPSSTSVTTIYDSRTGQPLYQIASSRPQPQTQRQHTQDVPSPTSTSSSTSDRSPPGGNKGSITVSQSTPPTSISAWHSATDQNRNHQAQGVSGKSELDGHGMLLPQQSPPTSSGHIPVSMIDSFNSQEQHDDHTDHKEKKDLSPTSVSSALSVLMSGPSNTQASKPSYRYAPKSVIANTYMRRLGSTALDQYRKNMSQLYKDFITTQTTGDSGPHPDGQPGSPTATVRPLNISSQNEQSDTSQRPLSPTKHMTDNGEDSNGSSKLDGSGPYKGVPPHDLDAERMHYRPNAPKLRRRLSSGESDDLRQFQPKSTQRQFSEDDVFVTSDSHPGVSTSSTVRTDDVHSAYNSYNQNSSSNTSSRGQVAAPAKDKMPLAKRRVKAILKKKGSVGSSRRVSFDPLALLLDASLEGELELVMRTATEVPDPSAANDEGITALHNAICAGHFEIVKFLVEYGCNVNSPDSDGWTPLHCAASCNNLPMVRLLVEHGACIFATTISDQETAAEKCEEDEDGYDGCSEYLYSVQEKLGIINKGVVYAVFDYSSQNNDELTFHNRDGLTVLRKGDENEKDWWWARLKDQEGYIPRNLLGLYPRVILRSQRDDSNKNKDS